MAEVMMRAPIKVNRNFRQHFEELVDELDSNPNIDIVELEFGDPAPEELFRVAQEQLGAPIPWEMRAFYREMNGFKLHWVLRNTDELSEELEVEVPEDHAMLFLPLFHPEPSPHHRISPRGVFNDWHDLIRINGDEAPLIRPVDCFIEDACAALYPMPGKTPTVHLHDFENVLHDTGRTFGQYIALALQSRGFWFWMAALTEESQDREEVEVFRTTMPILFPDFDDDLFQPPDY